MVQAQNLTLDQLIARNQTFVLDQAVYQQVERDW